MEMSVINDSIYRMILYIVIGMEIGLCSLIFTVSPTHRLLH